MTHWNIPKIREECLKLLGWTRKERCHPDGDGVDVWWMRPDGRGGFCESTMPGKAFIPDPTSSLNEALPLVLMNVINIFAPEGNESEYIARTTSGHVGYDDSAALAVCLCALSCAGRNLNDFKLDGEA